MRWISVAGALSGLTLLGVAVAAAEPPTDDAARVLSIVFTPTPTPAAVTANSTKKFFRTGNHLFLTGLVEADVQANRLEVDVNAVKVTLQACDAAAKAAASAQSQLCYSFDLPADLTVGAHYPLLVKVFAAAGNTVLATSDPKGDITYAGGAAPPPVVVVVIPTATTSASTSPPAGPAPGAALSGVIDCKPGEDRLRCAYDNVVSKLDDKVLGCDPKADRKLLLTDEPHNIYLENMHASDVAVLFFDAKGQPLFTLPQVDEDDRLYVVIVPQDDKEIITHVRVTACDAASILRIGGSAVLGAVKPFGAGNEAPRANPVVLLANNGCSTEQGFRAVFSVNETAQEIAIPTLALNRLTVGLGLVFDFSLQTEFRASAVKGESVPVIVQDQHQRGIVPPLPFVALRPFAVDSKRMRSFYQWWAPALGISLTEPLDHLYLGLLMEPFPGLGAIGGYHFHREPTLAGGYQIGDRIPGGVVATDKRWADPASRDFFLGLNIDASVLVNLLGKLK